MKKNIQTAIMVTAATLLLSACGGGSKPSSEDEGFNNAIAGCDSGTYTALQKGDKVTATEDAKVKLRHKEDGSKEACVESGQAKVN
jgi:hypothetical protein